MRPLSAAALAAAGLLGGWSPLAAQSQAPPDPEPPPVYAATLVVSATLEPEPAPEVAATVDVVESAEIELRQSDLVLDLLRTLPGLAVTQSGSPGKVASLFTRGTSSAHTLVLLDGVVLNDPVLGAFDWATPAPEGLERVEVARGPYSALWGSAAVGGVVQLVTRTPAAATWNARLEAGSHDLLRGGISAAAPLGPIGFDLSGSVRRGEGELDNDFFDGEQGQLRADWRPTDALRVGLLGRATDARIGLPFDFFGTPSPAREQASDATLFALPVDWTRGDWRVEAHAAQVETDLELSDPNDPFAASDNHAEREQGRALLTWNPSASFWVGAGFERQRETASTGGAFGPGLEGARQTTDAWFAQAAWSGERARIEGGVRRDDHSAFGSETSARGGVVISLGERWRARASYGESFRAPSLGDLFFPFFGNPDLRPERGESAELGIEGELGSVRARLTGFRNDLDDLIQFDPVLFLPFNIGRARTEGIEASLETRSEGWRGRLDATWLDAEDRETGAPLPRRPEWSASLVAFHTAERWDGGATVRYVGEREDIGRVPLASYATVDFAGSWQALAWLAPYARVENAFDRDYEEAAGFPAPGRSWALGVTLRAPH